MESHLRGEVPNGAGANRSLIRPLASVSSDGREMDSSDPAVGKRFQRKKLSMNGYEQSKRTKIPLATTIDGLNLEYFFKYPGIKFDLRICPARRNKPPEHNNPKINTRISSDTMIPPRPIFVYFTRARVDPLIYNICLCENGDHDFAEVCDPGDRPRGEGINEEGRRWHKPVGSG